MVLTDEEDPQAAREFIAEIFLFDDTKDEVTLRKGYEPVINTEMTR